MSALNHPAADIFPLMEGAEFDALVMDIKEHGLREPIVMHEGKILDGRNRVRACVAAKVEPVFIEWDQGGTPESFVVSHNLHRRHLTEYQRASIAAKLATAKRGGRPDLAYAETKSAPVTVKEAAELMNVGKSSVLNARVIQTEGTPAQIKEVEDGRVGIRTQDTKIRAARTKKKSKETIARNGKNPERIQRAQIRAEQWVHVKGALVSLTSLVLPA